MVVAGQMLRLAGKASDLPAASDRAAATLADGSAFAKFRELVVAQGGDTKYIDEPEHLPAAMLVKTVTAPKSGFVVEIHAAEIGYTAVGLGGGRAMKGDKIDHAVGLIVHHKVGDKIAQGDELFTIHANDEKKLAQAEVRALEAHIIGPEPVDPLPLFYKTIGNDG